MFYGSGSQTQMNCSKYFHSAPLEPIKTELKSILCCIVFRECGSRFYSFASMLTSDHIVGTLWHNIEVAKKKFKHIKHKKHTGFLQTGQSKL